jgi:hypothetical protein
MGIEHFSPVSDDPGQENAYANCFYCCRLCNQTRSRLPVIDELGSKLLDPCTHVWENHFFLFDDLLLPVATDAEAIYTASVYDLNDPRKIMMRRARQERLDESLSLLKEGPGLIDSTLAACRRARTRQEAAALLAVADRLRQQILRAFKEALRHLAIPTDADRSCRCDTTHGHILPGWLEAQTQEIEI